MAEVPVPRVHGPVDSIAEERKPEQEQDKAVDADQRLLAHLLMLEEIEEDGASQ